MDVSTERISKEDLMGYTISSKSAQRLATAIPSAALHNDIISKYDQRAVDEYNNPNLEASSYTFATDTRTYIIGDWTNLVTLRNGDPTTQNPITGFDPNVSIAALIPAKLRIETLKDQEDAERTGFNASIKNLVDQLVVKMSTPAKASSKNAAFEKIAPVAGVSKGTLFNWYNNANFNRSKTSRDQIKPLVETFVNNYSASPPQPKLKVGSPSDPLEQEADQMADVVMRSPKPEEEVMRKPKSTAEEDEKVQRKCSKCAEEETAQRKLKPAARISRGLYRKSDSGQGKNPAPTPPRGFDAQIGANKGRGKPLDTQTQSFMENRFGADFSNVKIHTGSNAAELNDKIQAKAFTTGSDIYFNRGEYNPSTQSGKKLLAHELTHTIQQGAAGEAVQRTTAGADFEVNGILDPAEQNPDTVYFDRKSSVLIKEQEDKIVDFMARNINSAELYLYGYSPEEEEGKEKDQLIAGRLSVVEDRVKKLTKKSTTVHTEARPNRSKKSYQYRKYRSVEMSAAEIESGAEKGNSKTRDCNQTEINTVDTVKTKATANIDNGLTQLEDYQKKPADHAGVEALIDRNFKSHDSKTVEKIVAILKLIKQDLAKISSHKKRRCSSLDHQVCASATAFAQAEKSVTFCPKYFNEPEPLQQRILVHEIGHFLKMNLDDRAYSHNRVFKFLSTEEALENTDSFAILINDLNGVVNQDVGNTLVDPSTDIFQNCGTNAAVVEEALAWSQRWSGYADTGLRQTYGDWGNFKFMAKHITALFGPVNRYSIAGLVDRMQLFKSELKKDFDFSCLPDADAACQAKEQITHTANTSFNVCPVFFTLSKPDQIAEVGKAVAKLVTSIPEKHREGYAKIGKAYKTHFFGDG